MRQKIFLLITCILFITSLAPAQTYGEIDWGDIQNLLEDEQNKHCEYISLQDGVFAPINFQVSFNANPTFRGIVEPLSGDLEYSEETVIGDTEGNFRFTTESIGEFRITLTENAVNGSSAQRNFLYRLEVSDADNNANIEKFLGNWQATQRAFCMVLEIETEEPFRERTEEEVLAIVEEDQIKRDELTQELIDEIRAGVVILAVGIILIAVYVGSDKIFYLMNRSKAEKDANKLKQLLTTQIQRLDELRKYEVRALDNMENKFNSFKQIMHSTLVEWIEYIASQSKKPPPKLKLRPQQNPYLQLRSQGTKLDLKRISNEILDKLKHKEKDEVEKFVEQVINADLKELYEMFDSYQQKISTNLHDEDARYRADLIIAEIKKRVTENG